MITNNKAIKTGKMTQFFLYQKAIQYGYKKPKTLKSETNTAPITDSQLLIAISTHRAKSKIRNLIIGNIYAYPEYKPVFLTLTTKENITELKRANTEFRLFIKRFNYYLGRPIRYIAVPEFQERGSVHYHILIFNLPFIEANVIRDIWKNGEERNIDIKLVNKGIKIFNYITKYISKNFIDIRYKNQKRYFYSLEHKSVEIYDNDTVYNLYKTFNPNDIINKSEYEIKSQDGKQTNKVVKIEFLTP